jgi:probable phosphoglycerate mutase
MTRILLLRHGDTTAGNKLTGRLKGFHLSEKGINQVYRIAAKLKELSGTFAIKKLISSPLERTLETAEIIGRHLNLIPEINQNLIEVDFGDWTGKTFEELEKEEQWHLFHSYRSLTKIPNGESFMDLQNRIIKEIEKLCLKFPEGNIVVVTHAEPIRSLIAFYISIPFDLTYKIKIDTGSLSIIRIDDKCSVETINFLNRSVNIDF